MMVDSMRRAASSLGIFLLVLGMNGCSDELTEATALNTKLVNTTVVVHDTTLRAVGSSTFMEPLPMNGTTNLLGSYGPYTAFTAIQFYPSIFPNRDTIQVLSATLTLRAVSWFGDSSSTFGFTVQRIVQSWAQDSLLWNNVQAGFYDNGSVRGSFSGTIGADSEFISVNLDTAMVREWLNTGTTGTTAKYGILLVPTPGTRVVRGISAFDFDSTKYYPSLQVIAKGPNTSTPDTATYNTGIDTFVGNVTNFPTPSDALILQSGIVYRSTLLFDLSSIPRGAFINKADVQLQSKPGTPVITKFSGNPSVVGYLLTSPGDSSKFNPFGIAGTQVATSGVFTFSVNSVVQAWLKGSNYGFLLTTVPANERSSFDLYSFFNQTANDTLMRPRLVIKYTIQ
jgi:hypothetical protein